MAGNIKGITIEFQGDTTRLDKALRQIQNNTKSLDRELKQVDKALKFNPTNVELWRQKQQLLTQKVDETKKKLDALKQAQAQMDAQGVDKNSEEYSKLQREIIVTENQVKNFEGQLRKIGNVNLRAVSEQFKEMGNKLTSAGQAMQGLSTAAAAVAASIGAVTVKSAAWADDINTMSKVYHIGTGELQKYSAAANLVDVDVETIAKSHTKLTKAMNSASSGTGASAEAFQKLGVDVTNADGSLRDADTVWQETIAALGQVSNETERDALAMQLMGKSAQELNPLIEDGGETYKEVADTLKKYNLDYIDQETLDQANEFNDSLDMIKTIGPVAFQQIGTQLAGYLAPALEKVVDLVGRLASWLGNLSPETQAVIAAIAGVVAVIAPLLIGLGKLSFAISSIMSLASTIGPMLGGLLSGGFLPIIAIIGAVIAVGVLLYKNWDVIKAKAQALWNNIKMVFNGIKTTIVNTWNTIKTTISSVVDNIKTKIISVFNNVKSAVSAIWNGIKSAIVNPIQTAVDLVRSAISKIKSIVNGAHLSLPHFKLPHFKISGGTLPWGIGGKGTPPKINVDWYAQGGIFDKASLIGVGEAGSEAVVPLDRFWQEIGNINSRTDALLARQNAILMAILEEESREKDFKVNGMWAGRYVNSLVR
jgi:phage-related minor tail protein